MKSLCIRQWIAGVSLMQSISVMALDELPMAYLIVARSHKIPADILYAVAMTESGKTYKGEHRPWPWALNIDGHSEYCTSQQDAVFKASQAIHYKQPVDLGLMQISWRWHSQRFSDVNEALIPIKNLSVGAAILYEQFELSNDWWEAVGRYHDPGKDVVSRGNAQRYSDRVKQNWREHF